MSVQIFVRGKLLGIGDLLVYPSESDDAFLGRSSWLTLITEVLPRALLAEFGLSKLLLGSSGGDQFLVVLPSEYRDRAVEFLSAAAENILSLSGGITRLVWAITENLGDWSDIRKRLNDELALREGTPLAAGGFVELNEAADLEPADEYYAELAVALRASSAVAWSPETPGRILTSGGTQSWAIDGSGDSILLARHFAPEREKRPLWGVLRGDVDNFLIRMRRLQTIEEFLQLSMAFKQFFAGELTLRCAMPEFWQKVSIIYTGGDDFAVFGDWDALLPLARELQRVFQRFAEENLKEFPGPEGKTITMAVALAPSPGSPISTVFEEAGDSLHLAKTADKDCIYALGRILEWKQLADAAELKDELTTLISRYGASPEYIHELCGLYRETAGTRAAGKRSRSSERPWRFQRKLGRILPFVRDREGQKVRADIIAGFVGRNPANMKLRPSGRVALEWARLVTEEETHPGPIPVVREPRRAKKRPQPPAPRNREKALRTPPAPQSQAQASATPPASEPALEPDAPTPDTIHTQPVPAPETQVIAAPDHFAKPEAQEAAPAEPPPEPARPETEAGESEPVRTEDEAPESSPQHRPE